MSITEEAQPVSVQIEQINDQLIKCKLINPVNGTVLVKYAEPNEVTATGKPLYKIADMSLLTLRAYITGDQLVNVKTGQEVKVLVDKERLGIFYPAFFLYDGFTLVGVLHQIVNLNWKCPSGAVCL